MTTHQIALPLALRIRGDMDRAAAGDLASALRAAGWAGARAMRPKHGAAEVLIAVAALTGGAGALARSLPGVLAEWRRRHRLREFDVIVERDGEESRRILVAGTSDAEVMKELMAALGGLFARDAE